MLGLIIESELIVKSLVSKCSNPLMNPNNDSLKEISKLFKIEDDFF